MRRSLKASLLFLLLCVCGGAFFVSHKLRERLPPPAPHELFAVVNEQLSAFRASDYQSAYRFAATGVQQRFTLTQFEKMMRRNYCEITRARRVEFGLVKVEGGSALVQVFVVAEDGSVRSFLYSLTNENDAWKIDGVDETESPQTPAHLGGTQA